MLTEDEVNHVQSTFTRSNILSHFVILVCITIGSCSFIFAKYYINNMFVDKYSVFSEIKTLHLYDFYSDEAFIVSMYLSLVGGLIIDLIGLPVLLIISIILFVTATIV